MTTTPAPTDLDTLRALLDAMPAGPWRVAQSLPFPGIRTAAGWEVVYASYADTAKVLEFIAVARNALPTLLDELDLALPLVREGALAEHHSKCGEASQWDIRRCEDAHCLERAHLLERHGLLPEEWGAYLANPTPCGSANPDMPFATCTYANGHGPIRVDLRDLGERDMDHGDETRGLLWNGTTAMVWAEAPLPTPVDADANPATTAEPAQS